MYWSTDVDIGIKKYLNTDDPVNKNKIYKMYLQKPFEMMSQMIIRTYRFQYFDYPEKDLIHELCSFMLSKIHLFTTGKGKSFSYFSMVVKNYLILHNNRNYKKLITHIPYDSRPSFKILEEKNIKSKQDIEENELLIDSIESFISFMEKNKEVLFTQKNGKLKLNELKISDTIVEMFKDRRNQYPLTLRNIKEMIKNITGESNYQVVKVRKLLGKIFSFVKNETINNGEVTRIKQKRFIRDLTR